MKIAPVPARSYAEPAPDWYVLNASCRGIQLEEPSLFCVVDLQEQLDAYKCKGLVSAVQARSSGLSPNQSVIFILWPDGGPVVPEIKTKPDVPREDVTKREDGGRELYQFWAKHGRPQNIEVQGCNLNVCVFNLIAEFLKCCQENSVEPPLIHFRRETLADSNYLDDPRFGWDHFRNVMSAYCPEQEPPADTKYVNDEIALKL